LLRELYYSRVGLCVFVRAGMGGADLGVNALFPTVETSIICEHIVWKAVEPAFAWLRGSDHRMSTGVRVLAGVLIR
jgi:hypothetical protein